MVLSKPHDDDDALIIRGKPFDKVQDRSVGRYLLERLALHGDAVSQIYPTTGRVDTYTDVRTRSVNVALEMRSRGIGVGDVVSVCSHNHPDIYFPVLATLYLGAVVAPLDPSLAIPDLKHLMSITRPKMIFVEASCVDRIERALEQIGRRATLVVFGDDAFGTFVADKREAGAFEAVDFADPYDHLALIMSSSGSTGLPKGVALSHGNLLMCLQLVSDTPMRGVKILNMSSLFWITSVLVLLGSIDVGVTRVILPKFDPHEALKTLEEQKIFWTILGVTYFARIVGCADASTYDLSATKMVSIVGAKASETQLEIGRRVFASAKFLAGYGMTETTATVFDMLDDPKPGSIGYVCRGVDVKIVDTTSGRALGAHAKGELCIRGGIVFKGYYEDPTATAEAIDADGWLHTGDLCWYDDDACFYIDGRIKEMFKCRGWQISPLEMENALSRHPDVKEVAVIGVPHDEDVARARAYVVRRDGSDVGEEEIHAFMRENMNANKQLFGGVVFVDELPMTPSGKVRRFQLHQRAKQEMSS